MKKYVLLFGGVLMLSGVSFADTPCEDGSECDSDQYCPADSHVCTKCEGGTVITAKNGTKFCKSNEPMTWWAANAWCFQNGGKLATIGRLCPGQSVGGGTCTNMKILSYNAWGFVNYKDGNKVGRVHLKDGRNGTTNPINRGVRNAEGEKSSYGGIADMYAVCE